MRVDGYGGMRFRTERDLGFYGRSIGFSPRDRAEYIDRNKWLYLNEMIDKNAAFVTTAQ